MKVSELIRRLKELSPDRRIVLEGQYGGRSDIVRVAEIGIDVNVNDPEVLSPHQEVPKKLKHRNKGSYSGYKLEYEHEPDEIAHLIVEKA